MQKINIDHVISLGSFCHVGQFLKDNNLKNCSYPFDWVHSNAHMVKSCIDNNFEKLLNKEMYIDNINNPNDKNKCGHLFYHKSMFEHHNPRNKKDYEYLVRCIDRFRDVLTGNIHYEKILFIILLTKNNSGNNKSIEDYSIFLRLKNILTSYLPNSILIIINSINILEIDKDLKFMQTINNNYMNYKIDNQQIQQYIYNEQEVIFPENLLIKDFFTISESTGTYFSNDIDNINLKNLIFSLFNFKIK